MSSENEHMKTPVRTFRDLIAWQKSMTLSVQIYDETRAMPPEERYGLTNQMRRSAVSIPSNIAEGHGRQSRPDYLKYLRIARGSLAELSTQYELATRIGMLTPREDTLDLISENGRILQSLIKSLENKLPTEPT